MSLGNGLSILFIFSKNQLLALMIVTVVSFVSFAFISGKIFMISFLLLTLGFLISSFSSCLRCRLGYLFDFSPVSWGRLVLLWTFPLALLLLNPIGFGLLCFIFIRFYANFDFFFDFFCDLLVIQQCVVQPPYVGFLNSFSPVIEIQSYCIVVRKDAWNDFYFFEFTKASFMAQDVIYPGEGSMCAWEKGEIHVLGWNVL